MKYTETDGSEGGCVCVWGTSWDFNTKQEDF